MCGILGWVGVSGHIPPLALTALRHRGPDDQGQGVYRSRSQRVAAALGATRLAILDLTSAGHMPMEHPEEPLAVVFNGEIYNFSELRHELEQQGERFFSRTDTEVILRGYRVWGDGVVARLRGMFAFGLWDGRGEGRLLLARDRFGKKPLYLREDDRGGLWFSSELKTLVSRENRREIDPASLEYFLDRGYPPHDRCLLRGYRKLAAGHSLIWENGQSREEAYWTLPPCSLSPAGALRAGLAEEFLGKLREAVRLRLVADVPVGLLLSGGVDSSSLLTLMHSLTREQVRTYTACFGVSDLDESEKARLSAGLLGSRHRALMINARSGRLLPFIASHLDEPIADPSAIATYLICRWAREEVTVLLTGDGSDELLLGYPRYRLHAAAQVMDRIVPERLRKGAARLLPPHSLLGRTLSAPADPLLRDRFWLDHAQRRLGASGRDTGPPSRAAAVRQVLEEDVRTWLVEDILMKVDKMSMAASVEMRAPFLDQVLAELVLGLPTCAHMSWRRGKILLWRAMKDSLPSHISWRKKQPFHLPIDDWLRSEWRLLAQDILLDGKTRQRGWLDMKAVETMLQEHLAGAARHGRRLYQLLILELWARGLLDKGETEPVPASIEGCCRELAPEKPVHRLAVLAPAGIGDTMRLTPALEKLAATDANASVTLYVAAGRGSDEVMAGVPPVDRHVLIDFQSRGVRKLGPLISDLRRNPPDQLISTWFSRLSGILFLLSGVRRQRSWRPHWSWAMKVNRLLGVKELSYNPSPRDSGTSDSLAFGALLGTAPLNGLAPSFAPPIWEERCLAGARRRLAGLPRPLLLVNAVAQPSIRQREYPLDLMAEVLRELRRQEVVKSIVLLGDAYSRSCHGELQRAIGPGGLDLSGELSLTATAALMPEGDAMLTIDGGLLHVALATDLPVLALYGPSQIYAVDPRGEAGRYRMISVLDNCRCSCISHRGIRVAPECRQQARCLVSIPPRQIVAALAALVEQGRLARGLDQVAKTGFGMSS